MNVFDVLCEWSSYVYTKACGCIPVTVARYESTKIRQEADLELFDSIPEVSGTILYLGMYQIVLLFMQLHATNLGLLASTLKREAKQVTSFNSDSKALCNKKLHK